MTEPVDHRKIYFELAQTNSFRAAEYLQRHLKEIYPEKPAEVPAPEPASVTDIAVAREYLAADRDNPMRAAALIGRAPKAITRGLEAIRGRRPMPPTDNGPQGGGQAA